MDQRTVVKLGLAVICIVFAGAVLHTHVTSRLYPSVHIGIFVSSIVLFSIGILCRSPQLLRTSLVGVVCVAVAYRVFMFGHPPTFHSIDVDWFTAQAQSIIVSGDTENIASPFYQSAPVYLIFLASVVLITGLDIVIAQASIPLLLGIFLPSLAWLLAKRVRPMDDQVRYLAAVVAAITTIGLFHSWLPIAQSLSIPWFLLSVILLINLPHRQTHWRTLTILLLFMVALIYTHKIPFVLFSIIAISITTITWKRQTPYQIAYQGVALLSCLLLIIQMVLLTEFFTLIVLRATRFGVVSSEIGTEPLAAYQPLSGTMWTIVNGANVIGILLTGGLAWIYGFIQWQRSQATSWLVILVASAVCVAFSFILFLEGDLTRGLMMIEPVLAVIIVVLFCDLYYREHQIVRLIAVTLFIGLLTTQSFALIGMPDNPGQPIRYMESDEREAKAFIHNMAPEQPYMDSRYALQMTDPHHPETRYTPREYDSALVNNNVDNDSFNTVLHRKRDVYYTQEGWFRLTWEPETEYNAQYSRVYDIGNTQYFVRIR